MLTLPTSPPLPWSPTSNSAAAFCWACPAESYSSALAGQIVLYFIYLSCCKTEVTESHPHRPSSSTSSARRSDELRCTDSTSPKHAVQASEPTRCSTVGKQFWRAGLGDCRLEPWPMLKETLNSQSVSPTLFNWIRTPWGGGTSAAKLKFPANTTTITKICKI